MRHKVECPVFIRNMHKIAGALIDVAIVFKVQSFLQSATCVGGAYQPAMK